MRNRGSQSRNWPQATVKIFSLQSRGNKWDDRNTICCWQQHLCRLLWVTLVCLATMSECMNQKLSLRIKSFPVINSIFQISNTV